ncbi:hypothetical protein ACJZ2D_012911 [Fusarium nematophilum]
MSTQVKDETVLSAAVSSEQRESSGSSTEISSQTRPKVQDEEAQSARPDAQEKPTFNRDYRFWMIMLTLIIATLLASLESTVVITSLPTIVENLHLGSNYIWVTNVFFLTTRVPSSTSIYLQQG